MNRDIDGRGISVSSGPKRESSVARALGCGSSKASRGTWVMRRVLVMGSMISATVGAAVDAIDVFVGPVISFKSRESTGKPPK